MTTRRLLTKGLVLGFVAFAAWGSAWSPATEPPDLEMRVIQPALSEGIHFDPGMGLDHRGLRGQEQIDPVL
jgi:hypothetical protein